MNCLILAAGYGTRMAEVTGDIPKALIRLGERTLLDLLIERLELLDLDITLVTNQKFHDQFLDWRRASSRTLEILNNGTRHPEERLGAVGDMRFAIREAGLTDDLLIVAADNLLSFSLQPMLDAFLAQRSVHVAVWHNDDLDDQRRRGVVEVDAHGRITAFTEKPLRPMSLLAAAPIYILPRELTDAPHRFLEAGGNPDAPGYLLEHLVSRHVVNAWRIPGSPLDVGNPESYARARLLFP